MKKRLEKLRGKWKLRAYDRRGRMRKRKVEFRKQVRIEEKTSLLVIAALNDISNVKLSSRRPVHAACSTCSGCCNWHGLMYVREVQSIQFLQRFMGFYHDGRFLDYQLQRGLRRWIEKNWHIKNCTVDCDMKEKSTRILKDKKQYENRSKFDGETRCETRSMIQLKLHETSMRFGWCVCTVPFAATVRLVHPP